VLFFGTLDIAQTEVLDVLVLERLDAAVWKDGVGVGVNESYRPQLRSGFDKTEAFVLYGASREPLPDASVIERSGIN
jgi:hypothetical protein